MTLAVLGHQGGGGGGVAHVILESAQGPNPSFFILFDFYLTLEPVGTRIWTRA